MSEPRDETQPMAESDAGAEAPAQEPVAAEPVAPAGDAPSAEPAAPAPDEVTQRAVAEAKPARGTGLAGRRGKGPRTAEPVSPDTTPVAAADIVVVEAPAADARDHGASDWSLRILLAGMMFLLLLCAIFIVVAA